MQALASAHALAEVYAALTRAPLTPPIYPAEVQRMIEQTVLPLVDVVAARWIVRVTSLVLYSECADERAAMILSFRDEATERLARGERVRQWEHLRGQAERRLRILEAARSVSDLMALNSNRLKALAGDRKGQYSIRVNDQWRLCFEWPEGAPGPSNVEMVDYH